MRLLDDVPDVNVNVRGFPIISEHTRKVLLAVEAVLAGSDLGEVVQDLRLTLDRELEGWR